ncbi:MAG: hypothetical protein ACJ75H_24180 [Thermoanaerobaculia bacterium]
MVLLVHASTNWYQEVVGRTAAPGRPEVIGDSEGLVALAWVDEGEVSSSRALRLWVLFENRAKTDVQNLHFLVFYTPGFAKAGKCWTQGAPACRPPSGGGKPRLGLPKSLKSGESAVVFAELKPKSWYGYHGASGVLAWQDAAGKTWQRAVVLPAVPVSSDWGRLLASLGKSIDLLKDLALPIALFLFGTYLQRRDKERESIEDERDRQQTLLRETWTLMLPKVHAYAETHYMPVYTSITAFRERTEENQRLFELLRLFRRLRKLGHTAGGLFFRDFEGEELAGETWSRFIARARSALSREDMDRAMTVVEPDENYALFLDKLEGRSTDPEAGKTSALLKRLQGSLASWEKSASFPQDTAFLDLYGCILLYEMNRPYEIWYGKLAPLDTEKVAEAMGRLDPDDPSLARLKKGLSDYLERSGGSRGGGKSGAQGA